MTATQRKKKAVKKKSARRTQKKALKPAAKKASSRSAQKRSPGSAKKAPPRVTQKPQPRREVYQLYEKALSLVHQKKYKDAQKALLGIRHRFPDDIEILDRINIFLSICETRLKKNEPIRLSQAEEFFDQGVVYHNWGQHEKALEYLATALKYGHKDAGHIHYAMAAAEVRLGNHENALKNLKKAIEIGEDNRFFAHNDPDFAPLATNERFQALLRPSKK